MTAKKSLISTDTAIPFDQQQGSPSTGASRVYRALRRDILFGKFGPGTKLSLPALHTRYDVGLIPIREALNRLAAERLIIQEDQRGFFVRSPSAEELDELTKTRCWAHEMMVRETIATATPQWEDKLVLAAHHLFRADRNANGSDALSLEWEAHHRHFHMTLVEGCASRWMQEFHAGLFDYNDFYRYQYTSAERAAVKRDVGAEHRALFDAAIARDTEALVKQLNDHVRHTARILASGIPASSASKPRMAQAKA